VVYKPIEFNEEFDISSIRCRLFPADHKVPSAGVIVQDERTAVAITGDTASLTGLRDAVSDVHGLKAILVECAFPNELSEIARNSHHMTPTLLAEQLKRLKPPCPVYVINIKPRYRDQVVQQLNDLNLKDVEVMAIGQSYFW
jgi:ribonuclease BN (tRNA processing enzyme)